MVWHRTEEHKSISCKKGNYFSSLYFPFLCKEQRRDTPAFCIISRKIHTYTEMPQTDIGSVSVRLKVDSFMIDLS